MRATGTCSGAVNVEQSLVNSSAANKRLLRGGIHLAVEGGVYADNDLQAADLIVHEVVRNEPLA